MERLPSELQENNSVTTALTVNTRWIRDVSDVGAACTNGHMCVGNARLRPRDTNTSVAPGGRHQTETLASTNGVYTHTHTIPPLHRK